MSSGQPDIFYDELKYIEETCPDTAFLSYQECVALYEKAELAGLEMALALELSDDILKFVRLGEFRSLITEAANRKKGAAMTRRPE